MQSSPRIVNSWLPLGAVACVTLFAGCSHGPAMTKVVGVVTIDGKPLQNGSITFEPADGRGFTAGATIENGAYEAKAPPGEKRVRITGYEIVGQKPAYPNVPNCRMRDIVKDVVPPRYNRNSELTLSVGTSETSRDFYLKSS